MQSEGEVGEIRWKVMSSVEFEVLVNGIGTQER